MWSVFKAELLKLRQEFVPLMKCRSKKQKWVTRNVIKCRRAKEKAWKKYKHSGKNQNEYDNYLQKLHAANRQNREAKVEFEKKLASNIKKDSKSFYAYIGSKQKTREKIGSLVNENGDLVTDNKESADLLNKYFSSVFTNENNNVIPPPKNLFMIDLLT